MASKPDDSAAKRRSAAAEQMRGMFAHVTTGVSLADELIADRRDEVHTERGMRLSILITVEGDDARRLEQLAIESGQQPSEVVSQLLRGA